jgi:sulfoxide reductase catalytic subunit YedY
VAIALFAVRHIALVAIEDFPRNMAWIIHGEDTMERVAVGVGLAGLVAVGVLHVLATKFSLRRTGSSRPWEGSRPQCTGSSCTT